MDIYTEKCNVSRFSTKQDSQCGLSPVDIPSVPRKEYNEYQKLEWDILRLKCGFLTLPFFDLKRGGPRYGIIANIFPKFRSPTIQKIFVACLTLSFLPVVSALDNEVAPSPSWGSTSTAVAWISFLSLVRILVGCSIALMIMIGGHLGGVMKTLVGPLMGFTSVLWMTMRNDSTIRSEFSWIVFGAWSALTLTYLCIHSFRVKYEKLYLLVTLAFAGLCICVLAFVQTSPTEGGLVTTVPLCVSFSAYAVAFFFPTRRISCCRRAEDVENGDL